MGKGMTGGHVAAPIFAHFVKAALAEKQMAVADFRRPPGIKIMRVSLRTGLRAVPGEKDVVEEAFKPAEEPDDEYSIIGFTNDSGTFVAPEQTEMRSLSSGRGGLY
jgi:penicillin-binding protein 1A